MDEKEIKLTPRQCALRRFLWANRTSWVSSKTIFENVKGYERAGTAYKQINEDYHAINDSGKYDKMIIPDRVLGYKLATKKEFKHYSKKAYAEAIRKIVYISNLIKSAKMDGQGIIPGLEGYQREFYDRFVKEEEECKKQEDSSPSKSSNATVS